ncbi:hypothetical protein [Sphingomonas sp. CROZ-RG-20F-R02-07]|uniref:hypothetical protein n=1 Tax=Sphingomonas sp. CROZ-RG-20F-R02-07 TaxID=2914832 RepID=UPI001F590C93|nr:hypothetical protein [Sphingomonas sp. CROZ-RG-20F-R02-07]
MDDMPGQALDPFEFHGHPVSCIPGLGGTGPLPDPTYAFHTPYVPVARGHAHFLVRFTNLQARRGSLLLRIHMLSDEPGAIASMVTSHRVQLNWLAHHGGETQLRFEAFRGARYAIMGLVPDQLDASAKALTITLDRPATEEDLATGGEATEARSTVYASETIRSAPAPLLLSLDPPSFAQPVSQPCTTEQLRESAFRKRCDTLRDLPAAATDRWQIAYILQVLDRYGALKAGARGLILGQVHASLQQALSAAGTTFQCVALEHDVKGCTSTIDSADLPGELFAFDFLLSVRATDSLRSDRLAVGFIENAMECLRPNGLSVHVAGYHPHPEQLSRVAFDRNGLERIAFTLISRGHQMARLKPALTQHLSESPTTHAIPFGLVARRASLIR